MPIFPWPLVALFLLLHALAGMAIGALTGWVVVWSPKFGHGRSLLICFSEHLATLLDSLVVSLCGRRTLSHMARDQIRSGQPLSALLSCRC